MTTRSKLALAALMAVASLATAIGTAGARRFEFSENHIRAIWEAPIQTHFTDTNGFFSISCDVTVEGSFHSRTISKVSGQLIGYITEATIPHVCDEGEAEKQAAILNGVDRLHNGDFSPDTLPWHVRYDSFTEVLPRIAGIRIQIIGASVLMWVLGLAGCLYRSTATNPLFAILEIFEGRIRSLRWDEARAIPLTAKLFGLFCPASGKLEGFSASFEVQGRTTKVLLRLVQ